MATEDISRFLFQPNKRYSSVRMQQGRVLLDSDWNEFERLDNEDDRQTLIDIVCAKGTPNNGFHISSSRNASVPLPQPPGDNTVPSPQIETYDFDIASGSFYLGGLRFEAGDSSLTFLSQPDWLQIDATAEFLPARPPDLEGDEVRYHLVYLRGWEQCVTAVEDSELRERALGGPDSSVRIRRIQRVEVLPLRGTPDTCAAAFAQLQQQLIAPDDEVIHAFDDRTCELQSGARLTVTFNTNDLAEDPCRPENSSGYLGADNQTIRVQLTAPDQFIWSYDNAAPLYRVQVSDIPVPPEEEPPLPAVDRVRRLITFLTLPRDQEAQPLANQAVEIIPWGAFLPNQEKVAEFQGQLFTVATSYNPVDNSITIAEAVSEEWIAWLASHSQYWSDRDRDQNDAIDRRQYFYLRLWTGGSGVANHPDLTFEPGEPVPLPGTGLSVTFSKLGIPGDFWVIAARPNTPQLVVPWNLMEEAPPTGPKNYFAPLALIRWRLEDGQPQPMVYQDCRDRFQPLCRRLQGCCTVTVGDGSTSQGLFNSLQDALDFLPPNGGKICLLPGRHRANVSIQNRQHIQITGCGTHTIVHPHPERATEPIIQIATSQNIQLDHLTFMANTGTAIQVLDQEASPASASIHILHNRFVALIHAIEIRVNNTITGANDIQIAENLIGMLDLPGGQSAIFLSADGSVIEGNRVAVVLAPDDDTPGDPPTLENPAFRAFNTCLPAQSFFTDEFQASRFLEVTFGPLIQGPSLPQSVTYQTQSGIQIDGGADGIKILNNEILGGRGHGITLGYLEPEVLEILGADDFTYILVGPPNDSSPNLPPTFIDTLYNIHIAENTIKSMGLSGISVVAFLNVAKIQRMVRVEDLTIYRNVISDCARQLPAEIPEAMLLEVGFGGIALTDCEQVIIQENRIDDNGLSHNDPICGIFILQGEKIDISRNRILNNGPRISVTNNNVRPGLRGGIVMGMAFVPLFNHFIADQELLSPDGVPAARIHDNIITQPLAQALNVVAFGPVSVIGNRLTSQGADFGVNPTSLLAGAVFIQNLGISKDFITALLLSQFALLAYSNIDTLRQREIEPPPDDTAIGRQILYLPNGNVLFVNNQTTLDLRTEEQEIAFSAQFIVSWDDIAYNSNQTECTSLLDIVVTDVALFGVTIRSNDNRFQEGLTVTQSSLFSWGLVNTATGNQATHCVSVFGTPDLTVDEDNIVLYSDVCQVIQDPLVIPPVIRIPNS